MATRRRPRRPAPSTRPIHPSAVCCASRAWPASPHPRRPGAGYALPPTAGVLLDFWHCDANGQYDNVGYRLRGHLFSDAQGRYRLETILPGLYPGRTRHIHVRAQAPGQPILTTQLYFPNEPLNARDWLFHPACLMELQRLPDGSLVGRFNFILAV